MVSIFLIPFAVILSSIIHFQLSHTNFILDLKVMIESMISNENHLQLFFLMQLFLEIIIIYALAFNKNSLSTEINEITKSIKTPKIYGNGQYGTARWSSKKELYKKLHTNSINLSDVNNVDNIKFKKRWNCNWFRKKSKKGKSCLYIRRLSYSYNW